MFPRKFFNFLFIFPVSRFIWGGLSCWLEWHGEFYDSFLYCHILLFALLLWIKRIASCYPLSFALYNSIFKMPWCFNLLNLNLNAQLMPWLIDPLTIWLLVNFHWSQKFKLFGNIEINYSTYILTLFLTSGPKLYNWWGSTCGILKFFNRW